MEELFGNIDVQKIIVLIPFLIAIYKGILSTFDIADRKLTRNLIAIALCIWTTYNLVRGWTPITTTIDTFLILYFGTSGILDIPKVIKDIKNGDSDNG